MKTREVLATHLLPASLRLWAEEKPEGAKVGEPESNEYCPLATFLNEQTQDTWSISDGQVFEMDFLHGERDPGVLPVWAMLLVLLVDALPGQYVTREQLLSILDRVEQEAL